MAPCTFSPPSSSLSSPPPPKQNSPPYSTMPRRQPCSEPSSKTCITHNQPLPSKPTTPAPPASAMIPSNNDGQKPWICAFIGCGIASAKAIFLSIGARAPTILQTTTRNTTLPHTIASNADNTSSSYTQQPNVRSQLVFTVSPLTASPSRTILHTHHPINFTLLRNFGNLKRAHTPRRKFLHMYCKGVLILDLRVPYRHNTSVTYIEHMIRQ
jgi:hypothetical protein